MNTIIGIWTWAILGISTALALAVLIRAIFLVIEAIHEVWQEITR